MQVVSIFIAVLAVSRFALAQSQSGYNYPSPFNQLAPGAPGDLGAISGSNPQQSTSYPGSQPAYNNPQFTPSVPQGPPSFGATPTPSFNQQSFGQPTASNLPASIPSGHSSIPGVHSSIPGGSHSSVPAAHSGAPGHSSGGFGPSSSSSSSGFPAASVPSSKGFESGFPHQGAGHSGGHSGTHSGNLPSSHTGSSFPGSSSGFPGSTADSGSAGFGAPSAFGGNQGGQTGPGFSQGQPQSFGAQGNNFGGQGPSGGNTQFQGENDGSYQGGDYSAIPGTAGVDYPIYTEIPKTSFDCKQQQFPGYYADVEAQCQVFHICALNTTFNFLCPNGTIFSQEHLVCVWWNQFDCNSAPSLYGNNAYIYDYSKTGQSQEGQGPSRNFGNAPDAGNNFDGGAQGPGFGAQGGSPGFGASQPGTGFGPTSSGSPGVAAGFGPTSSGAPGSNVGFGPSSHSGSPSFGAQSPSSGFGPSAAGAPAFSTPVSGSPGFGPTSSGAPGFGSSHSSGAAGYPSSPSAGNIPSSGFGQPSASHTPGFGQSHIPSSGASHTPSHNVPSSHSFPAQPQAGGEQYPIVPPSQTDYNQSPVIAPTIPSSPAPFGIAGVPATGVTGYPPAGAPSSPTLTGEQPSREYLPQRRTK